MTLMIGPVYMGPDCADAHSAEQPADIMWSVHIIGSECGEAYSAKQPVDIIRPSACTLLQRLLMRRGPGMGLSTNDIFRYGSFDT